MIHSPIAKVVRKCSAVFSHDGEEYEQPVVAWTEAGRPLVLSGSSLNEAPSLLGFVRIVVEED